MNLTIDIGNTNIMICLFSNQKKLKSYIFNTTNLCSKKLLKSLINLNLKNTNIIISSVVPVVTNILTDFFKSKKLNFYYARDLIKLFNLKTNMTNKKKIGDDRLVNILYAKELFSKSIMVIDFGTATTIDVLDSKGVYDGGIITPGIDLSLKSLQKGTAKLPLVKFKKIKRVVGKNTMEAIQSGFFWGYISMIQGLVKKVEIEKKKNFKLIITGGNAKYFLGAFRNIIKIDEFFNSKALNFIMNTYLREMS